LESGRQWGCISAIDFVEHLDPDELVEFFHKVRVATRVGGLLILRTSCSDGLFGAYDRFIDPTHCTGFTANSLKVLLESFKCSQVEIIDERPLVTSLRRRLRLIPMHLSR
jgi:cyclopropane fatty-acyl-phospholipid synthase-like methyltransferase